jgi:glycosyltransferase involved in cell wall biosynthesis
MKIAVFSNLWPPVFIGGYEIGCAQIIEELRKRGHEILVIAAHDYHGCWPPAPLIHRRHSREDRARIQDAGLCLMGSLRELMRSHRLLFVRQAIRTWWARRGYRAALRRFRPDVLLICNPLGVLAPVIDDFVAHSRETGAPVWAYVSEYWVGYWPAAHPLAALMGQLLVSHRWVVRRAAQAASRLLSMAGAMPSPLPLIDRYLYCSDFIRSLSLPNAVGVAGHQVVHWGIPNLDRAPLVSPTHFESDGPLTILYAGQVIEQKGLLVLIRALARCTARHSLVVIGDAATAYGQRCRDAAARLGVLDQIRFVGKKPNHEMLGLLSRSGQVLVVPSVWNEPFSIVLLEGMSVGLVVVASDTGGTGEAITDVETGFLFAGGNDQELAAILNRLDADRPLCQRVGARACQVVSTRFTMEHMVDQILAGPAQTSPKPLERVPGARQAA